MHPVFFYGYAAAGIGFAVSMIYAGLFHLSQQRNLRAVLENASIGQYFRGNRHTTLTQRYSNRHRTKLITRRMLHKINQLAPRVHLLSEGPGWKLIYTPGGEIRAIPRPS